MEIFCRLKISILCIILVCILYWILIFNILCINFEYIFLRENFFLLLPDSFFSVHIYIVAIFLGKISVVLRSWLLLMHEFSLYWKSFLILFDFEPRAFVLVVILVTIENYQKLSLLGSLKAVGEIFSSVFVAALRVGRQVIQATDLWKWLENGRKSLLTLPSLASENLIKSIVGVLIVLDS